MMEKPTEDEVAAAFAAISLLLMEEQGEAAPSLGDWRWQASGVLLIQRVPSMIPQKQPTWGNIERLRRAGQGNTGITGL